MTLRVTGLCACLLPLPTALPDALEDSPLRCHSVLRGPQCVPKPTCYDHRPHSQTAWASASPLPPTHPGGPSTLPLTFSCPVQGCPLLPRASHLGLPSKTRLQGRLFGKPLRVRLPPRLPRWAPLSPLGALGGSYVLQSDPLVTTHHHPNLPRSSGQERPHVAGLPGKTSFGRFGVWKTSSERWAVGRGWGWGESVCKGSSWKSGKHRGSPCRGAPHWSSRATS